MSAQGKERGDALEIARGVLNWHFPKTDDVWIIAAALDSALSEVAQLRVELQAAKQAIWGLQGGMKWVPEAEYRRLREAALAVLEDEGEKGDPMPLTPLERLYAAAHPAEAPAQEEDR